MKRLFIIFILISISACSNNINLLEFETITINNIELKDSEITRLNRHFKELKRTEYEFYYKPEIILRCYNENNEVVKYFSIFLKEQYVYEGYYLEAFTERMLDRKSNCLILNKELKEFFILLNHSR